MKKLLLLTAICVPIFYAQSASPIYIPDSEQEQEEMINNPHFLASAGVGLGGSSNKTSHYSIPFGVESEYLFPKTHIGFSAGIGVVEDFSSLFSEKEKLIGPSSLLVGLQIAGIGAVNIHLKADDINSPFVSFQYMPTTKISYGSKPGVLPSTDTSKPTSPTSPTDQTTTTDSTTSYRAASTPVPSTTSPSTPKAPKDRVAITFNVRKHRFQFGIGLSEPLKIEKGKFIEETRVILNAGVCF